MTSRQPLWRHAVALGCLLAVLLPLLGRPAIVSADEGAVLATVNLLHRDGSWSMTRPLTDVDPDGRWFGFDYSDQAGDRAFPYAKHAVYPAAVEPLFALGGETAVVAASTLGTLAAAVLAALLARRLRPGLEVATLWSVGVLSPLFFDGYWVVAHSLGAALATLAVLATSRLVGAEPATGRARVGWSALVVVGVVGAALFRSEGVLFGLALGAAVGALGVWRRRVPLMALGVVVAAAASGCRRLDARIASNIVGQHLGSFTIRSDGSGSWLDQKLDGAWATLLRPQLQAATVAGSIWMTVAVLAVIAAAYLRWKPTDATVPRIVALLAAVGALVVLVAFRPAPVPGLLVAVPLLPAGLLLVRRRHLADDAVAVILGASALFGAAVLATQYAQGGSMEWGGRYFHLVLPALVPVVLMALADTGATLDRPLRRTLGGAALVVALVLTVTAAGSIARLRSGTDELVRAVTNERRALDGRAGEQGVVIANVRGLARFAWADATAAPYLSVPDPDDLPTVGRRLAAAGVDEVLFAAAVRHGRDPARLAGFEPVRATVVGDWELTVLRRR